jgi:hypothetical protein
MKLNNLGTLKRACVQAIDEAETENGAERLTTETAR